MLMKFYSILLLFLQLSVSYVSGDKNIKILRILPQTEEQLRGIRQISEELKYEIDFLVPVYTTDRFGDIVVPSKLKDQITTYLKSIGVQYKEIANEEMPLQRRKRSENSRIELSDVQTRYLSYSEQVKLLTQIRSDNPSFAFTDHIGLSTEEKRMMMITFGYPSPVGVKKPMLFLNCGLHAREWIASASCSTIMWKLGYEPEWRYLLEQIDIAIIPNANPDGYEYTRENVTETNSDEPMTSRLWRKNRRGTFHGTKIEKLGNSTKLKVDHECIGVDLNRNFPYKFNYTNKQNGVSRNSNGCSVAYSGPYPLSEHESRNVYQAIQARLKQIKGFLDIHSYSQLILMPYSHDYNVVNENLNDLVCRRRMATVMKDSMDSGPTKYTIMTTTELYPCEGVLPDTVMSLGVKYSYTVELPPSEKEGYIAFNLPAERIVDVSEGLFKGIVNVAKELVEEYGTVPMKSADGTDTNSEQRETVVEEPDSNQKSTVKGIEVSPQLLIIMILCILLLLLICAKYSLPINK